MNQVIFVSRSGNTKKVAESIARGIGVTAAPVGTGTKIDHADILFVGGALYAGKIAGPLRAFLETLTPEQVGKVAVFSTACTDQTALNEIKSILAPKNIPVAAESFHCKASFLFLNRARPNEEDLKNAENFAKRLAAGTAAV
jgi:flavodoxin